MLILELGKIGGSQWTVASHSTIRGKNKQGGKEKGSLLLSLLLDENAFEGDMWESPCEKIYPCA